MISNRNLRILTYSLTALGCAIAFVAAVVPQPVMGHELRVDILLLGLLPYIVYGMSFPYLERWKLAGPMVAIVVVHAGVVASERFVNYTGYSEGLIFVVPVVLALVAAVILALALHRHPMGRPWDDNHQAS